MKQDFHENPESSCSSCLNLLQQLLRAGFESKQCHRDREFPIFHEMHERRHHAPFIRRHATVVAKKHTWIGAERRQINLMIHKRLATIDTAREG